MSLFSNIIAFYYDDYSFGGHFVGERPYRCKWRENEGNVDQVKVRYADIFTWSNQERGEMGNNF